MQTVHTPLNVWLGKCHHCVRPVRVEVDGEVLPPAGKHTDRVTDCVECGRPVLAKRLWGMVTDGSCDGRCMSALGNVCSCACGGKNHGKWFAERTYREVPETEGLRRYRAEQKKLAQKRQAKVEREARKARAVFNEWADDNRDVIDWLTDDTVEFSDRDQFLWDMLEAVRASKPLTLNQANAVRRIRDARTKRNQEREEERRNAKPLPTGRVEITGTVLSAKPVENDFGTTHKMLVRGEGWKVWTTIPRDIMDALDMEWAGKRNSAGQMMSNIYSDYPELLKGRTVTLTVTIEPSRDDPIFGFGKRPAKAKLLPAG